MSQNPLFLILQFCIGLVVLIVLAVVAFYAFLVIFVIGFVLFAYVKARRFLREKGILKQPQSAAYYGASNEPHQDIADGPTIDAEYEVVEKDEN